MPNPIVHWEIQSKKAKKLQEFYSKTFGWHIDSNNPINYGLIDTHTKKGINGGIAQTDGPNSVKVYVEVDDLEAYLKKVEKSGGKTVTPITVIPNMVTFAEFADPEGNIIGLVKAEGEPKTAG